MIYQGLYLHIPFCTHRCGYCDFNTYDDRMDSRDSYVDALEKEISQHKGSQRKGGLKTLYFGGGTPSLLAPEQIARLVNAAEKYMGLKRRAEITLEANPGTVTLESLRGYRNAGVNRISFGFQAAQHSILKKIERDHNPQDSLNAWQWAREAGFTNMSLDLMFGLPDQTMEDWEASLDWALSLVPEHISFYGLTVEAGTPFARYKKDGNLPLPNDDLQADMYEEGIRRLAEAGLEQYEISNFARTGLLSKHNQLYWENLPTLGLGAGAWSFDGSRRWGRVRLPEPYALKASQGEDTGLAGETLEGLKALGETAMLGLRLLKGLDLRIWKERTGRDWDTDFGPLTQRLAGLGLIEIVENSLRLTKRGIPLANEVFSEFV